MNSLSYSQPPVWGDLHLSKRAPLSLRAIKFFDTVCNSGVHVVRKVGICTLLVPEVRSLIDTPHRVSMHRRGDKKLLVKTARYRSEQWQNGFATHLPAGPLRASLKVRIISWSTSKMNDSSA